MRKYVLMAIKPQYAYYIKEGTKTIELRKIAPKVNSGDMLIIYESAPISKITAYGKIEHIFAMSPHELWKLVTGKVKIDEDTYYDYFTHKKKAYGILKKI